MLVTQSLSVFEQLMAAAPEAVSAPPAPQQPRSNAISEKTGLPGRYRGEWPLPEDAEWHGRLKKAGKQLDSGGTLALIGSRGTGKTRLAAELMRHETTSRDRYTTAMGLFLRIRRSFSKGASETEADIVDEMSDCPLLVIDEIQERGNTGWEDRIITHILDRRYSEMMQTIIIANLTKESLSECLGDSVVSRMQETGGVMEMKGKSFREKS